MDLCPLPDIRVHLHKCLLLEMQQLGACCDFWAIIRVNIEVTFVQSHLFCVKDVSVIRALLLGKPRQQICGISPPWR